VQRVVRNLRALRTEDFRHVGPRTGSPDPLVVSHGTERCASRRLLAFARRFPKVKVRMCVAQRPGAIDRRRVARERPFDPWGDRGGAGVMPRQLEGSLRTGGMTCAAGEGVSFAAVAWMGAEPTRRIRVVQFFQLKSGR
jgi:hypothetical protein